MTAAQPHRATLLLVGGGHSHLAVLRRLALAPVPGLRVVLVSREVQAPYSGMLPGHLVGLYAKNLCHTDLRSLATAAGAVFIHGEATGLDPERRELSIAGRPPVAYDVLSLNTGSTPDLSAVPGAARHALPVKPVDRFLEGWAALQERCATATRPLDIVIVGGGAAGVELALCAEQLLDRMPVAHRLRVICKSADLLAAHAPAVRRRFERLLADRGIAVDRGVAVAAVDESFLRLDNGQRIAADAVLWATGAGAPAWLADSSLALDDDGFLLVDRQLRALGHGDIFAGGDMVSGTDWVEPKAGVAAVRHGVLLADNVFRRLAGRPLRRYRPRPVPLALISAGQPWAVASRGALSIAGWWVWSLKDEIDQRFMRRFRDLPLRPSPSCRTSDAQALAGLPARALLHKGPVPAIMLEDALDALRAGDHGALVPAGLSTPSTAGHDGLHRIQNEDDALVTATGVPLLTGDDFEDARVGCNHALQPLFARGAQPTGCLVCVTVPAAAATVVTNRLQQLLGGVLAALARVDCPLLAVQALVGDAPALALTFTASAFHAASTARALPGDRLLLSKPLGALQVCEAVQAGELPGDALAPALHWMSLSSRTAAALLGAAGARGCVGVANEGLAGAVAALLRDGAPEGQDAPALRGEIHLDSLPLCDGAMALRFKPAANSLPEGVGVIGTDPLRRALVTAPQLAGGLLAVVPADAVAACLAALRGDGKRQAAEVGVVVAGEARPGYGDACPDTSEARTTSSGGKP